MGKHGSVSSSFRTQKPSRVRDKPRAPSVIPGPLRSWHSPPDHGEQAQVFSPPCQKKKTYPRPRQDETPSSRPSMLASSWLPLPLYEGWESMDRSLRSEERRVGREGKDR